MSQLVYNSTGSFALKEPIAIDFLVLIGPSLGLSGELLAERPQVQVGIGFPDISCHLTLSLSPLASLQHLAQCSPQCPRSLLGAAHTFACSGRSPLGEELRQDTQSLSWDPSPLTSSLFPAGERAHDRPLCKE